MASLDTAPAGGTCAAASAPAWSGSDTWLTLRPNAASLMYDAGLTPAGTNEAHEGGLDEAHVRGAGAQVGCRRPRSQGQRGRVTTSTPLGSTSASTRPAHRGVDESLAGVRGSRGRACRHLAERPRSETAPTARASPATGQGRTKTTQQANTRANCSTCRWSVPQHPPITDNEGSWRRSASDRAARSTGSPSSSSVASSSSA